MKRSFVVVLVACLLAAGCAEDSTPNSDASAVTSLEASPLESSTSKASTPAVSTTTAAPVSPAGDFGSRYNGAPVAFWFWAPY
ncbi:MAG: hypothetical protein EBU67_00705 [Actinobacteria bacterium]|nr:hypothetical protein [Actinomycetota bacterium]